MSHLASALPFLGVRELNEGYRKRDFDPVDVFEAVLNAADAVGPLNALSVVLKQEGRSDAEASARRWHNGEERSILDGVPVTVKDSLALQGVPSTKGSRVRAGVPPEKSDELAVARLREAGSVFVAKTTMPEYAWAAVSDSPLHGVVRNAVDPSRTAGGSSGGAAVAIARGIGTLALGSDGAGSIRIPAAFNGVVGLKATYGAIPALPSGAFGRLAHIGPLARTVDDIAFCLPFLGAYDPRDPEALELQLHPFSLPTGKQKRPLRIGFTHSLDGTSLSPQVSAVFSSAIATLAQSGVAVEPTSLHWPSLSEEFSDVWSALLAAELTQISTVERTLLSPGLLSTLERGEQLSSSDLLTRWVTLRDTIGAAMASFHEDFDLLITPSTPLTAFAAGQVTPNEDTFDWIQWTPFTWPFNVTGQPAISVPAGTCADRLPVGLHIVGRRGADYDVIEFARHWEEICPA